MSCVKDVNSDSDVSSTSSWTILNVCDNFEHKDIKENVSNLITSILEEPFKFNDTETEKDYIISDTKQDTSSLGENLIDKPAISDTQLHNQTNDTNSDDESFKMGNSKTFEDFGLSFIINVFLAILVMVLFSVVLCDMLFTKSKEISKINSSCSNNVTSNNESIPNFIIREEQPIVKGNSTLKIDSRSILSKLIERNTENIQQFQRNRCRKKLGKDQLKVGNVFPSTYEDYLKAKKLREQNTQMIKDKYMQALSSDKNTEKFNAVKVYKEACFHDSIKSFPSELQSVKSEVTENSGRTDTVVNSKSLKEMPRRYMRNEKTLNILGLCVTVLIDLISLTISSRLLKHFEKQRISHENSLRNSKSVDTLRLLKELPFFARRCDFGRKSRTKKPYNKKLFFASRNRNITKSPLEECKSFNKLVNADAELCINNRLRTDPERVARRQLEYLEKLNQEQNDRIKYLQRTRELQQRSIECLIKQRRVQMQLFKEASCGKYNVPIPNVVDVKKKLQELSITNSSTYNFAVAIENGKFSSNHDKFNAGSSRVSEEELLEEEADQSNLSLRNTFELRTQKLRPKNRKRTLINKKYWTRIEKYLETRELYMTKHMDFMDRVSNNLNEVMENYRNRNSDSSIAINVINRAVSTISQNRDIETVRSDVIRRKMSIDSLDSISRFGKPSNALFSRSEAIILAPALNSNIKEPAFYKMLFGRKGCQIRERDISLNICRATFKAPRSETYCKTKKLYKQSKNKKFFNN